MTNKIRDVFRAKDGHTKCEKIVPLWGYRELFKFKDHFV